jgi:hypothetical protein
VPLGTCDERAAEFVAVAVALRRDERGAVRLAEAETVVREPITGVVGELDMSEVFVGEMLAEVVGERVQRAPDESVAVTGSETPVGEQLAGGAPVIVAERRPVVAEAVAE